MRSSLPILMHVGSIAISTFFFAKHYNELKKKEVAIHPSGPFEIYSSPFYAR